MCRHYGPAGGRPSSLWLEESSSLGSGGIFGRGSELGSVATSLFRVNARPRKPIAIKIAPPTISQCGNSIAESKRIYFPFALLPSPTMRQSVSQPTVGRKEERAKAAREGFGIQPTIAGLQRADSCSGCDVNS